jgi:hypothetical protein
MVEKLLVFGANFSAKNFAGDTPFEVAHFTIYNDRTWIRDLTKKYTGRYKKLKLQRSLLAKH